MFAALRHYSVIGFDFDKTLVEGDNSEQIWEFIRTNPYDQTFHIVTFRSGGLENYIWADLQDAGSQLMRKDFGQIFACSHDLWLAHKQRVAAGIPNHDDPFLLWKGEVCARNGIEVLIDDDIDRVSRGCLQHDILLIHPHNLV